VKNVLVIGFGSHAQRRVLPALSRVIDRIGHIFVLTSRADSIPTTEKIRFIKKISTKDYPSLGISLIVVCNENSLHLETVVKYAVPNIPILVEKPICVTVHEFKQLIQVISTQHLLVYESWMYQHHRLWKSFCRDFSLTWDNAYRGGLIDLNGVFELPVGLDQMASRNVPVHGGAFNDVGCYFLSLLTSIEQLFPVNFNIHSFRLEHVSESDVIDSSGHLIGCCDSGNGTRLRFSFFWGYSKAYVNELTLSCRENRYHYKPFFSKNLDGQGWRNEFDRHGALIETDEIHDQQFENMYSEFLDGPFFGSPESSVEEIIAKLKRRLDLLTLLEEQNGNHKSHSRGST
jgi:predicted dehydrogenase